MGEHSANDGPASDTTASDLSIVLRRLALEPDFATQVSTDPLRALARYRLTAADLSALAIWLERRAPGSGMVDLFDDEPG